MSFIYTIILLLTSFLVNRFLFFQVKKEMPLSELLEITKQNHNDWNGPRKRLIEKGIIDGKVRGEIRIVLPRFCEYVENQL